MVFLLTENRKQTRVMKYMTNQPKQCTILQGTSLKTGPQTLGTKFDSSQNPSRSKTPAKPLGVFSVENECNKLIKRAHKQKKNYTRFFKCSSKLSHLDAHVTFGGIKLGHFEEAGTWHESGNRLLLGYFPFPRSQIF